ncbi:MAG: hypothetical protein M3Z75_03200 [Actinomycetota bacterium]|nr:hypothetical protein [Actinomycetota bacterium]
MAAKARIALITGTALLTAAGALAGVLFATGNVPTLHARSASSTASVPLLGASVSSTDLAATTAQFGPLPIVRVYYPGLPASNAWVGGAAGANHSAVIVSFKALPTDILSGADDAALTHFFDTAPTGHPIYYSYYHEPEDNITAGQFTLADFKAAWARVVKLANAAHNPDLHSTLILMNWDLMKASGRDWKSYLPGGGIISTLGWDAYPFGSPANFMGLCITASESVGLPYGFPEFGLPTPVNRPAWITAAGNYLLTSGALFASYFNGSAQDTVDQLTDQASQNAWKGFVAKSFTANKGTDPAPSSPAPTATTTPSSPAPTASAIASQSPSPISSAPAGAAPPAGGWVTGLTLSPAQFAGGGDNHTVITFRIGQSADVTVLVLRPDGTVVRQMDKPAHAAGQLTMPYYGYTDSGVRLPAGTYEVLIVASNGNGSATEGAPLTISAS